MKADEKQLAAGWHNIPRAAHMEIHRELDHCKNWYYSTIGVHHMHNAKVVWVRPLPTASCFVIHVHFLLTYNYLLN